MAEEFVAVAGFRAAIPPDRPDLLLLEIKTFDGTIVRFSMAKQDALMLGEQVTRVATSPN